MFYSRAEIQRTIVDSPAFLEHGSAEKIAVYAHTNHHPNKQDVGFSFVWSESELRNLFKYSTLKWINQKPKAGDAFFKDYPIMRLSCRSNSGRTIPLSTVCSFLNIYGIFIFIVFLRFTCVLIQAASPGEAWTADSADPWTGDNCRCPTSRRHRGH
jgi:hypothetical protein